MKSLTDVFVLKNGVTIPCVGYGTWKTPDGDIAVEAVKDALAVGFRHIDTAAGYHNEASIGRAVAESGLPREEVFITSKLYNNAHGYSETMAAFEDTMAKLNTDYLDLYLIHWPNPVKYRDCWEEANAGTWKAFEELYEAKRIRAIGISNFCERHIQALMRTAKITPMVNQIRLCPGDTQDELVKYCRDMGMVLQAYSPLGGGLVFEVDEIKALAAKYNKTIAQIVMRWCLQMDFLPLTKSVTPSRIRENADIFDFELEPEDVQLLIDLRGCCGYSRNPDTITF